MQSNLCIDFITFGCWFVVYIRRFIYKFLNVCPFDCTAVAGEWRGGPMAWELNFSGVARRRKVGGTNFFQEK